MTEHRNTDNNLHVRIELLLYATMVFLASKQLQDWIMHERAYGNGRTLYPFLFSVFMTLYYFKIKTLNQSNIKIVLFSLLVAWLSSSIAMLLDSIVNLDFGHQVTSGGLNIFGLGMSVFIGPWIILSPIVGVLVTLLFKKLRIPKAY